MSSGGLSKARLGRMRDVMSGHVERGAVPGLVSLISRRGETHVEALGVKTLGGEPMRRDTLFRIASMSKPVAAAAAMILVEECRLRLDEPVDRFLPELAQRRVLKRVDGPLEDTVPAHRPLTLRDLLTLRMGLGHVMEPWAAWPIRQALNTAQLLLGPPQPQSLPSPDEWLRRVGSVPLLYQPGERWLYDLGLDVLGVLISRVVGQPLETFLRARLFEPLGMKDTGFSVPAEKLGRLATSYVPHPNTGVLGLYDEVDGQWSRPPLFESASGGLVSTVDDYLAFGQMLLNKGRHGRERILSRPSVELMTSDQLTAEQKVGARVFFEDHSSWGLGLGLATRRDTLSAVPGAYGWTGGLGTLWQSDPQEQLVIILMTQVNMTSPTAPPVFQDFETSAYQAIDD